jgi:adenylate cyclase
MSVGESVRLSRSRVHAPCSIRSPQILDDVTRRITDALKVTLSPAEKALVTDTGTTNMEAYNWYLRGRELLLGSAKSHDIFEQSKGLLMRAIELDPNYARAYAGLAFAYMFDYQNRWSNDPDGSLRLAKQYAEQAIEKNPKEPAARVVAAMVASRDGDFDRAKSEVQTALSLNPNFAMAYNVIGAIHSYSGQPLEAIPMIERAMRLDPAHSEQYLHFLGMAYLLAGKYETAASHFRERIRLVPRTDFSRAPLASALGHLGEIDEAKRIWRELMEINPKYSFSEHFGRLPFKRQEDVQRVIDGLAKAGLPT